MSLELWSINLGQGRDFLRKGSAARHATRRCKINVQNVRGVMFDLWQIHVFRMSIDLESLVLVALQST